MLVRIVCVGWDPGRFAILQRVAQFVGWCVGLEDVDVHVFVWLADAAVELTGASVLVDGLSGGSAETGEAERCRWPVGVVVGGETAGLGARVGARS